MLKDCWHNADRLLKDYWQTADRKLEACLLYPSTYLRILGYIWENFRNLFQKKLLYVWYQSYELICWQFRSIVPQFIYIYICFFLSSLPYSRIFCLCTFLKDKTISDYFLEFLDPSGKPVLQGLAKLGEPANKLSSYWFCREK